MQKQSNVNSGYREKASHLKNEILYNLPREEPALRCITLLYFRHCHTSRQYCNNFKNFVNWKNVVMNNPVRLPPLQVLKSLSGSELHVVNKHHTNNFLWTLVLTKQVDWHLSNLIAKEVEYTSRWSSPLYRECGYLILENLLLIHHPLSSSM